MVLKTRGEKIGLQTGVDATQLCRISKLVSRSTSYPVPPNKAIVGGNAFAHESGIHQDGMIKNAQTYEIMRPQDVGATQTELVLGKHSGRAAFSKRLAELGYPLEGEALVKAFGEFKKLADRKKSVHDADLIALASDERARCRSSGRWRTCRSVCGSTGLPTATVRLRDPDGKLHVKAMVGTGPVDATYKAIDAIVKTPVKLLEFGINGVTEGIDALAEASVRVAPRGPALESWPRRGHRHRRCLRQGLHLRHQPRALAPWDHPGAAPAENSRRNGSSHLSHV